MVSHDRYWNPEFLQIYLSECELLRLQDAEAAWNQIRWAADLARRIRVDDGGFSCAGERWFWLTRALILDAEIAAAVGRWDRCTAAFNEAESTSRKIRDLGLVAELHRRRASVLMMAGHRDERGGPAGNAERLLSHSIDLYRRGEQGRASAQDLNQGLSEALLLDGCGSGARGVVGLSEAIYRSNPHRGLGQKLFDGALSLLMAKLDDPGVGLEAYDLISRWIYAAQKRWLSRPRKKCKRKQSLIWAEGRVLSSLGLGRLAERRLGRAWQGFSELGEYESMVLAALDLAYVVIGHGDRPLAQEILRLSRQRVHRQCGDGELKEVLAKAEDLSLADLGRLRLEVADRWLPSESWWWGVGASAAV